MAEEGLKVDSILCSAAARAKQTAAAVAAALHLTDENLVYSKQLYLATPNLLLTQLSALPANTDRVMLVAHNPGLEQLLYHITKQKHTLRPASLAHINLSCPWNKILNGSGELLVLKHP